MPFDPKEYRALQRGHWVDYCVDSADDFERIAAYAESEPNNYVYRGESRPYAQTTPRLFREQTTADTLRENAIEDLVLRQIDVARTFISEQQADGECEIVRQLLNSPTPLVAFEVMQHYSQATMLVDWSWCIRRACYFACNSHPTEPGVILGFLWGGGNMIETTLSRLDSALPEPIRTREFRSLIENNIHIALVRPKLATDRISAQRGLFSISVQEMDHRVAMARAVMPHHTRRFVIPAKLKRDLMLRLRAQGIDGESMFPDRYGIEQLAREKNQFG